jgi:hypothetical protein
MGNLRKYLDPFQIIGFAFSLAVSIWLIRIGQDTILSLLVGLALAAITQLFDLQARMVASLGEVKSMVADGPERVIQSLDGVDVQQFAGSEELLRYVIKRMREARKTIDDLTMGMAKPPITETAQKAYERYLDTIAYVCSKRSIAYRDVTTFPPRSHLERAEFILSKNLYGYRLRYYEYTQEDLPPRLQFMVIDSEEVIFAYYRAPYLPIDGEIRLAVRHPRIVALFKDYYEAIWQGAKVLKEGDRVEVDVLQELKERLAGAS